MRGGAAMNDIACLWLRYFNPLLDCLMGMILYFFRVSVSEPSHISITGIWAVIQSKLISLKKVEWCVGWIISFIILWGRLFSVISKELGNIDENKTSVKIFVIVVGITAGQFEAKTDGGCPLGERVVLPTIHFSISILLQNHDNHRLRESS